MEGPVEPVGEQVDYEFMRNPDNFQRAIQEQEADIASPQMHSTEQHIKQSSHKKNNSHVPREGYKPPEMKQSSALATPKVQFERDMTSPEPRSGSQKQEGGWFDDFSQSVSLGPR